MSSTDYKAHLPRVSKDFQEKGYAVIPGYLTEEEVQELRNEIMGLVKEETKTPNRKRHVHHEKDNYSSKFFMDSSDQLRYFYEKSALDPETNQTKVQEEFSLAKMGHAVHHYNDVVRKYTSNEKVRDIFKAIGFVDPVVVQSMVIFKNPEIGHAYPPHQDAAYLCAEPAHVAGLWIALDDATAENGCLDFIPGSHKKLERRLVRTGKTGEGEQYLEWTGPAVQHEEKDFVPAPAKRGDLVILDGLVVHRSSPNTSKKSRWVYTFHAYDKGRAVWSKENWLQCNTVNTFLEVNAQ